VGAEFSNSVSPDLIFKNGFNADEETRQDNIASGNTPSSEKGVHQK
jgi:hypothetical protein